MIFVFLTWRHKWHGVTYDVTVASYKVCFYFFWYQWTREGHSYPLVPHTWYFVDRFPRSWGGGGIRHPGCEMGPKSPALLGLSDQGTFTPVGDQGVSMEPPKKTHFPPEFGNEICNIYVWTIKNNNSGKKWNVVSFQNGGQITDFYFTSFRFWPKFEKKKKKKHFPKGIFQWNLAQSRRTWIDLHYWNNI